MPDGSPALEYKDYYEILGVPRNADEKAIRRAFRKLAREYHPDVNPNDPTAEERFKEITEAYEVLSDAEKRKKYDQFGREWKRHEQAGETGGFDWGPWVQQAPGAGGRGQRVQYTYTSPEDLEELFGGTGFSDFFEALFGGGPAARPATRRPGVGRGAQRQLRGRNLEQPIQVSLSEAYHGASRILSKDGRRLEVRIPPGVRTGSKVRLTGEGGPGPGGSPAGDLYLLVEVADDPRFERRGNDLHTEVEVPLVVAVLGGEVRVPTLDGDVALKVPPETQNGRRFRLAGKGMPKLKSPEEHGDLYAELFVRLPTGLTDEERKLFEQLRDAREDK